MNNYKFKIIIIFTAFFLLTYFEPIGRQQDLWAWNFTGVKAGDFSPGQLEAHYLKHGYQFGQITQGQYLQGAQELLDAPPGRDILEKIRPNGDIEHFKLSTGEFAVMTKRGRIRTYFKTDYGYWMREP